MPKEAGKNSEDDNEKAAEESWSKVINKVTLDIYIKDFPLTPHTCPTVALN